MSLKDESVMEDFKNITITRVTQDRYCISIKWGKTRHRYYNGSFIGIDHKEFLNEGNPLNISHTGC